MTDARFARGITAAMDARGAFLGPALAAVVADVPMTALLDVGGSSGVYACAVLDRVCWAGQDAAVQRRVEEAPHAGR